MPRPTHPPLSLLSIAAMGAALSISAFFCANLGGCGNQKPAQRDIEVQEHTGPPPLRAILEETGTGRLSWVADQDGTIYVYDFTIDSVIFNHPVHRGDRVILDPKLNRLTIDGREMPKPILNAQHQHTIYFIDSRSAAASVLHQNFAFMIGHRPPAS